MPNKNASELEIEQKEDLVSLVDRMGTHDLLSTIKMKQSEYTLQNMSNDFIENENIYEEENK